MKTRRFILVMMLATLTCSLKAQSFHMTVKEQTDWKEFNNEVKAFCQKYSGPFLLGPKLKLSGEPVFSPVENDSILRKLRGYFPYVIEINMFPCGYPYMPIKINETEEQRKEREIKERRYQACIDSLKAEERKTAESILAVVYNYWEIQNIPYYQNNRELFFYKLKEEVNRISIVNNLVEKPRNEFETDIFYIKEKCAEFTIQNMLDAIIRINRISLYSEVEAYRNLKQIIDDYYNADYSSLDICSGIIEIHRKD
jgi:hypothetical protein